MASIITRKLTITNCHKTFSLKVTFLTSIVDVRMGGNPNHDKQNNARKEMRIRLYKIMAVPLHTITYVFKQKLNYMSY